MISAAELAAMQAVASASLDLTATLARNTPVADGWGSQTDAWATVATGLACGLAKPSAVLMQQYAAKVGSLQTWVASLPTGTDVREGDHLIVGSETLLVQALLTPQSYSTLAQAFVSEVR